MTARKALALLLTLPLMIVLGYRAGTEIKFRRDVMGHLERSANASTTEMASQELTMALAKIENRGMTHGTTALFYPTPGDDVGYWHRNLRSAQVGLESLSPDASELEKSNMLLKLRETILEHSDGDDEVTSPEGIAVFPNNQLIAAIIGLCLALAICGCIIGWRSRRVYSMDLLVYGGSSTLTFLVVMLLCM